MVAPWLYKVFLRATRVSGRRFFLPTSWRRQILWFQELEQRITPTITGGVNVAAGDINGDRFADIVTGQGLESPRKFALSVAMMGRIYSPCSRLAPHSPAAFRSQSGM